MAAHLGGPCPLVLLCPTKRRRWRSNMGMRTFKVSCRAALDGLTPSLHTRATGLTPASASLRFGPYRLPWGCFACVLRWVNCSNCY